jgi:hypothetical protein
VSSNWAEVQRNLHLSLVRWCLYCWHNEQAADCSRSHSKTPRLISETTEPFDAMGDEKARLFEDTLVDDCNVPLILRGAKTSALVGRETF